MPSKRQQRTGPWDRATQSQGANEFDFVIGRLQNIQGAAEGPNLPPPIKSGARVTSPTGFQLAGPITLLEGRASVPLTWSEPAELLAWQPTYRVRCTGGHGDIFVSVKNAPAVISVPMQVANGVVTFKLETRLSNGLVAAEEFWPSFSATLSPPESYIRAVATTATATDTDRVFLVDLSGGDFTINLFNINELPLGFHYVIVITDNGGGGTVTLDPSGATLINGGATYGATTGCEVWSDGTNWWVSL
jgi:hypothetical protein